MSRFLSFGASLSRFSLLSVALMAAIPLPLLAQVAHSPAPAAQESALTSVIVQAKTAAIAAEQVTKAGAEVDRQLQIISAVSAQLDEAQVAVLEQAEEVERIWRDVAIEVAGDPFDRTFYPTQISAHWLHYFGIDGTGVTVAVVDTGMWRKKGLKRNSWHEKRVLAQYDAFNDEVITQNGTGSTTDENGHGTHVTGIIMDSTLSPDWNYRGVAPGADLVSVQAFDFEGKSTYADVIAGLDWVVANRMTYGIRVLNLSFSAPPQSFYWDDPLNQAVMRAWQSGIVVVTSAGNRGPEALTVGAPGNVPYVITVGAMTDGDTPFYPDDDRLASFSSAGPSPAGFIKPDVVAPGGHMLALMSRNTFFGEAFPQWREAPRFYRLSGTSQSAAVVSGLVALMLEVEPHLTPDQIKCRIQASARPALDDNGDLAYSVLQQGTGLVNALAAVLSEATDCGNRGLDVDADLDGAIHFGGPVRVADDGSFVILGLDGVLGSAWDGVFTADTYPWVDTSPLIDTYPWVDSLRLLEEISWEEGPWSTTYPWVDSYLWSSTYPWVDGSVPPVVFGAPGGLPEVDMMALPIGVSPSLIQE